MIEQIILDAIPFGILITDQNLHILNINRWITNAFHLQPADWYDRLLTDVFPDLQERGLHSIYELVVQSEQRITISNRIHKYFLKMPGRQQTGTDYMPQSTVVAPLFTDNQLTGTITIISDVSERLITESILNREIDRLSTLHNIDLALATLDLQACLDIIVTQTQVHFAAQGIAVFLAEGQELSLAAGVGLDAQSVPPVDSLAAWCFQQHKPRLLNYLYSRETFNPLLAGSETELAAPLLTGDKCIGVIQASITQPTRTYDRSDLDFLKFLAGRAAAAIENARLHQDSEHWRNYYQHVNQRLQTLLTATRLMSAYLDLQEILDAVAGMLMEVFAADCVLILKLTSGSNQMVPLAVRGVDPDQLEVCTVDPQQTGQIFSAHACLKNCSDFNELGYFSPECCQTLQGRGLCQMMYIGLSAHDKFTGILHVFSADAHRQFSAEERELFEALASQLSLAIENAELYARQQKLAVTDGLTGVFNRRRFDQELELWLKRALRSGNPLALILLDIDNFKRFNDTFGHQAGDEVLKLLATMVSKNVREIDIVARYGGEEFVVILPNTSLKEALRVAERIRQSTAGLLKQAQTPQIRDETLSASFGVACAPFHGRQAQDLLTSADQFLYTAKRAGKNRVVTSQE